MGRSLILTRVEFLFNEENKSNIIMSKMKEKGNSRYI